jgi:hypothetical protein
MTNMIDELIRHKLNDQAAKQMPGIPISFRGQEFTAVQLEILAKLLDYPTRSKFLAELVMAAIEQAIDALPKDLERSFTEQFTRSMRDADYRHQLLKGKKK